MQVPIRCLFTSKFQVFGIFRFSLIESFLRAFVRVCDMLQKRPEKDWIQSDQVPAFEGCLTLGRRFLALRNNFF
jgi:hypothetical protein